MSRILQRLRIFTFVLVLPGIAFLGQDAQAWKGDTLAPWVGTMLNGTKCDGGQVPFGPYDYLHRNELKSQLEVVEESHFNEDVENLTKGMSASAMGDIHYTLQTWPNHHRALNSAFRFRMQHRELWNVGNNTAQNYPAECYLQRAMNFSPNDPIPYMLHGMLMHQMKQYEAALKSYRQAIKLQPQDLITQYNMGLTLVELKKFQEAEAIAKKVYAADFPLPGLKRKLAEAKQHKAGEQAAKAGTATVTGPASKKPIAPQPGTAAPAPAGDAKTAPGSEKPEPAPADAKASQPAAAPPQLSPEELEGLKQALRDEAAKKGAAGAPSPAAEQPANLEQPPKGPAANQGGAASP